RVRAGEERGGDGWRERWGGVGVGGAEALSRDPIHVRGGNLTIAVAAEPIGAERVDGHDENVLRERRDRRRPARDAAGEATGTREQADVNSHAVAPAFGPARLRARRPSSAQDARTRRPVRNGPAGRFPNRDSAPCP